MFKIGDRVKLQNAIDFGPITGAIGIIVGIDNIDVAFPINVRLDDGTVWVFGEYELKLIDLSCFGELGD